MGDVWRGAPSDLRGSSSPKTRASLGRLGYACQRLALKARVLDIADSCQDTGDGERTRQFPSLWCAISKPSLPLSPPLSHLGQIMKSIVIKGRGAQPKNIDVTLPRPDDSDNRVLVRAIHWPSTPYIPGSRRHDPSVIPGFLELMDKPDVDSSWAPPAISIEQSVQNPWHGRHDARSTTLRLLRRIGVPHCQSIRSDRSLCRRGSPTSPGYGAGLP